MSFLSIPHISQNNNNYQMNNIDNNFSSINSLKTISPQNSYDKNNNKKFVLPPLSTILIQPNKGKTDLFSNKITHNNHESHIKITDNNNTNNINNTDKINEYSNNNNHNNNHNHNNNNNNHNNNNNFANDYNNELYDGYNVNHRQPNYFHSNLPSFSSTFNLVSPHATSSNERSSSISYGKDLQPFTPVSSSFPSVYRDTFYESDNSTSLQQNHRYSIDFQNNIPRNESFNNIVSGNKPSNTTVFEAKKPTKKSNTLKNNDLNKKKQKKKEPMTYAFISHSIDTYPSKEPEIDNAQLARTKRRRTTLNELNILQQEFEVGKTPNKLRRIQIAEKVGMTEKTVQIWFQNKRQNLKKAKLRLKIKKPNQHKKPNNLLNKAESIEKNPEINSINHKISNLRSSSPLKELDRNKINLSYIGVETPTEKEPKDNYNGVSYDSNSSIANTLYDPILFSNSNNNNSLYGGQAKAKAKSIEIYQDSQNNLSPTNLTFRLKELDIDSYEHLEMEVTKNGDNQ
ncbi:uncharacterized protein ASCRUDRAFT_12484 [Ascoidea rubescens DSM 1968]|uniref:Homeobox domain-containing protein n=1 Tax=Ascoidea rubescens DSM 1968 TaxID=1344418 RepID=A0A1D2VLN4_9ASCO|nr:hypothetical protein ASCRUDRAFT_12484 [Ascoidea rubescens DSM 1968]ODV62447.1 hypothetical protein ASCRUDRAFT_12484 [Ascoidea rubescens DSM 1968]